MSSSFDPEQSPSAVPETSNADLFTSRLRQYLTTVHHLPRHRHASHLMGVLHTSRHAMYRRLDGNPTFDATERNAIAAYHKISVEEILRWGETPDSTRNDLSSPHPYAILKVALHPHLVRVEFATNDADASRSAYVAVENGANWELYRRDEAPASAARSRAVIRIIIDLLEPALVGVLEDDADAADLLRYALEEAGMNVEVHASIASLSEAARTGRFEAYVCDWYIDNEDAGALITSIRAQQPHVPIVIASGKIDIAGEASLQTFADAHGAEIVEKPYRPSLVAARLRRLLDAGKASR